MSVSVDSVYSSTPSDSAWPLSGPLYVGPGLKYGLHPNAGASAAERRQPTEDGQKTGRRQMIEIDAHPYSQGESLQVHLPLHSVCVVRQLAVARCVLCATAPHSRVCVPPGPREALSPLESQMSLPTSVARLHCIGWSTAPSVRDT